MSECFREDVRKDIAALGTLAFKDIHLEIALADLAVLVEYTAVIGRVEFAKPGRVRLRRGTIYKVEVLFDIKNLQNCDLGGQHDVFLEQ